MNNLHIRLKSLDLSVIIVQPGKKQQVTFVMNKKINVLDMQIDNCTAKEAMKQVVQFVQTEPVNVVKLVTADTMMKLAEVAELKQEMGCFDLVLAGEKEILQAAGITDRRSIQEVDTLLFVKMFMRFLHKNKKRVFLLMGLDEEALRFTTYLESYYPGIHVEGYVVVPDQDRADDMIVNHINGAEADCVLAVLSSPKQEEFVIRNKMLLNTRIWFGMGSVINFQAKVGSRKTRLQELIVKHIFKKEIEKENREKV